MRRWRMPTPGHIAFRADGAQMAILQKDPRNSTCRIVQQKGPGPARGRQRTWPCTDGAGSPRSIMSGPASPAGSWSRGRPPPGRSCCRNLRLGSFGVLTAPRWQHRVRSENLPLGRCHRHPQGRPSKDIPMPVCPSPSTPPARCWPATDGKASSALGRGPGPARAELDRRSLLFSCGIQPGRTHRRFGRGAD